MIDIFWIYKNKIYSYKENVTESQNQDVEMGHVEYLDEIQSEHKNLREFSYDYIPRGRVLLKNAKVLVYSSNEIIENDMYRNKILNCFKLEAAQFVYDEHYENIWI
jgi:hypothetical protein